MSEPQRSDSQASCTPGPAVIRSHERHREAAGSSRAPSPLHTRPDSDGAPPLYVLASKASAPTGPSMATLSAPTRCTHTLRSGGDLALSHLVLLPVTQSPPWPAAADAAAEAPPPLLPPPPPTAPPLLLLSPTWFCTFEYMPTAVATTPARSLGRCRDRDARVGGATSVERMAGKGGRCGMASAEGAERR